jgi:predicted GNAT family N-acyltransferase
MAVGNRTPLPEEFIEFRAACGWGVIDIPTAEKALECSLLIRSIYAGGELVGFGRVVGDGVLNFYIQDLIVKEEFRSKGLGAKIMTSLMDGIIVLAQPGATIGLMAAYGKEHFYETFGFAKRPNNLYGAGMTVTIPVI